MRIVSGLVLLAAAGSAGSIAAAATIAPFKAARAGAKLVPSGYIVTFQPDVTNTTAHVSTVRKFVKARKLKMSATIARGNGTAPSAADSVGGVASEFSIGSHRGFAGKFDDETLTHIRALPGVAYVEPDTLATIHDTDDMPADDTTGTGDQTATDGYSDDVQSNASWGLDRIVQRGVITNMLTYRYNPTTSGQGVKVYVLDTGINTAHVDFHGHAVYGTTFINYESPSARHMHGTHVAGTVGSMTYGVAKGTTIIDVKIIDSSGYGPNSAIISGINWVVQQHKADVAAAQQAGTPQNYKGAVINMSLTSTYSAALNAAAEAAIAAGVHVVSAAGNYYQDACGYSPASSSSVITVGATTSRDTFATFSNYGRCVTILGPGDSITSLDAYSNTGTRVMSGTSMSSPHVSGSIAYILSQTASGMTPAQMKAYLERTATSGAISSMATYNTPNLLLYRPDTAPVMSSA